MQLQNYDRASAMDVTVDADVSSSTNIPSPTGVEPRVGVMLAIFLASLFAVSFPWLELNHNRGRGLRLHPILFFIGKHFGTGVILATAFIHLLDDAFRSLQDKRVETRYGKAWGRWAGGVILASLLLIFLVEYASTSYVEHLQDEPSLPPSPVASPNSSPSPSVSPSRRRSVSPLPSGSLSGSGRALSAGFHHRKSSIDSSKRGPHDQISDTTPLILRSDEEYIHDPHRYRYGHSYSHNSPKVDLLPIEVLANSPRVCRLACIVVGHGNGHHLHSGHDRLQPGECVCIADVNVQNLLGNPRTEQVGEDGEVEPQQSNPRIGRRRQVVGILILQLGIMIHSLVIGLTLSVTSGSDFTSLTTAIIFHQLFEGLSLGIRIASLPPSKRQHHNPHHHHQRNREEGMAHSGNVEQHANNFEENRAANAKSKPPSSCFHGRSSPHLYLKMKLKAWLANWPNKEVHWLKPTLSFLFGIMTPLGMGIGMIIWNERDGDDPGPMLLTQGLMSAISAGMLIYAATVEMIAGDFVFGDVEGGHQHHHHQHQHHEAEHSERGDLDRSEHNHHNHRQSDSLSHLPQHGLNDVESQRDQTLREADLAVETDERRDLEGVNTKKASLSKRILAVVSLFGGAGMMVVVGMGE